jgi:hypothetical protein
VLKSLRAAAMIAVLLCGSLGAGVAVADSPNLENVTDQYKDTRDGWRLHVSLYDMTITSVPNMAATAFTREAFVSATAEVWVEALHPDERDAAGSEVTQRSVSLWLQQGCQAQVGVSTLSESVDSGGSVSPGSPANLAADSNPSVNQTLQPGYATAKNLQNKAYPDLKNGPDSPRVPPWVGPGWTNDKLTVSVRNWNLGVDSCAGPVSFRFIAEATMSTTRSDDAADAFSAIVQV